MTAPPTTYRSPMSTEHHAALHLAHRWFAFLEAPGGDLDTHLLMFHPAVRLSGNRKSHRFASDHASLIAWFAAVPDAISAHHIIHSTYSTAENGDGLLNMVIAYQTPDALGTNGSIISYQTRIEFGPAGPRFTALDKTPILPDTRDSYETSWAANRALALVHGDLAGLNDSGGSIRSILGDRIYRLHAVANAAEGSNSYEVQVVFIAAESGNPASFSLSVVDDGKSAVPKMGGIGSVSVA